MSLRPKLKRIAQRDWEKLLDDWLSYLPDFDPPGSPPEHSLAEFSGLKEVADNTPQTGEYRAEVQGLREAVFREGIYLLHKAAHVVGACQVHLTKGMPSWSMTSAYHGALFAAKGIMSVLGVTFTEIDGKIILIDVWPELPKPTSGQRRRGEFPPPEMVFVRLPRLLHHQVWEMFQRVLRVTTVNLWQEDFVTSMKECDSKGFARLRNRLLYSNHSWMFEDLHNYMVNGEFIRKLLSPKEEMLREGNDSFVVLLGFVLLSFAHELFEGIATKAPILADELRLFHQVLQLDCHSYYSDFMPNLEQITEFLQLEEPSPNIQ